MDEHSTPNRIDMMAGVDPDDIHFRIVRLPAPPAFQSGPVTVTYEADGVSSDVAGEVHAELGNISASIQAVRIPTDGVIGFGTPGKLLDKERFGVLRGGSTEGQWVADGAVMQRSTFGTTGTASYFAVNSVTLNGPSREPVAYTREVYVGRRLQFLTGCLWTPKNSQEAAADRIEEHVFDKRMSVRDLRTTNTDEDAATAIVYDGEPLDEVQSQAVWLALSVLAGSTLQTVVRETYDAKGELIARVYRPGIPPGSAGNEPFHLYYAPYPPGAFAVLCERIAGLLAVDYPIDVVIAHLHDANDGYMERRMQSCLFGIHAASEAWNRINGKTRIVTRERWDAVKTSIASTAKAVAARVNADLAAAVENAVLNANNTGTGQRLRNFFAALGLSPKGETKKALELRNPLFHDGFLQRRFSSLGRADQQKRYDHVQILREFTLRLIFAICAMDVSIHSLAKPTATVDARDYDPTSSPPVPEVSPQSRPAMRERIANWLRRLARWMRSVLSTS